MNLGYQIVCIVSMSDYAYSRLELVDVSFQMDARARRIEAGDWRTVCDLGLSTRPLTQCCFKAALNNLGSMHRVHVI